MIRMIAVESSMVHSIGYDPDTKRLRVKFKDGGLYAYTGVPQSVYDKLMDAQSIGKFMRANVIGVYEAYKITEVLKKKKRTRK